MASGVAPQKQEPTIKECITRPPDVWSHMENRVWDTKFETCYTCLVMLHKEMQELDKKVDKLIAEVRYRPGNSGYEEAKDEFEEHVAVEKDATAELPIKRRKTESPSATH